MEHSNLQFIEKSENLKIGKGVHELSR